MRQSVAGVKDRREASFKVDHAILAQIFGLLVSNSLERPFGLHHCDGVGKAFQILRETPLVRSLMKPLGQRCRIAGRKVGVLCFLCQVNDRLRPQHAVQMFVQEHLGQAAPSLFIKLHRKPPQSPHAMTARYSLINPSSPIVASEQHRLTPRRVSQPYPNLMQSGMRALGFEAQQIAIMDVIGKLFILVSKLLREANSSYSPPLIDAIAPATFFFIAARAIRKAPCRSGRAPQKVSSRLLPRSVSSTCESEGEKGSA